MIETCLRYFTIRLLYQKPAVIAQATLNLSILHLLSSAEERRAHNPEVDGSKPSGGTQPAWRRGSARGAPPLWTQDRNLSPVFTIRLLYQKPAVICYVTLNTAPFVGVAQTVSARGGCVSTFRGRWFDSNL